MKRILKKILVYIGIILSIISIYFFISSVIESLKPVPNPEEGNVTLDGLGEAVLIIFSIIFALASFAFYAIDNIILIISSLAKKKKGILLPLITTIIILIDLLIIILIGNAGIVILYVSAAIHLIVTILEIVGIVKYFNYQEKETEFFVE